MPVPSAGVGTGGSGLTSGGSKPDTSAGSGGESSGSSGDGGSSLGAEGGADSCAEPAAPGCFSCCEPLVCPPDFADCDGDATDCETPFGSIDGCTPELGSVLPPAFGMPVVSADGFAFVSGAFVDATDFDPGPAEDVRPAIGGHDGYVSKYSPSGEYLWTYTFGKHLNKVEVAPDRDGSVVVAGELVRRVDSSSGTDRWYTDVFVARLGADGKLAWLRVFKGVSAEAGGSTSPVATDDEGRAIVVAKFSGDIDFGRGAADVRHFPEFGQGYLLELDVDGAISVSQPIGGDGCYFGAGSLAVSRETIAVEAWAGIDCVIDGRPLSSREPGRWSSVVTFTRQGILRDVWMLGGVRHLAGPLSYDDGAVVVAGMFEGELRVGAPGTVVATEQTHGADFILRLSKNSRVDWLKVFPVPGRISYSIARTPEGGVLGATFISSVIPPERHLVAWHSDGTAAWTRGLGCSTGPLIVSNGGWFLLKTEEFGACDLEPGESSEPANGFPYWATYRF